MVDKERELDICINVKIKKKKKNIPCPNKKHYHGKWYNNLMYLIN